jgi:YebC/PmpR family DNA-binding regulatory protein
MPRKHLIESQCNKKQQFQAKKQQKLAREIKAAVKVGGNNPDANPRLKAAIEKALRNGLSKDSIDKNVNGKQDNTVLTSCEFECYGPQGIKIIVGALTDNTNRTISSLNGYLSKLHGELAKTNSVKVFFDKFGYIILLKDPKTNVDQIFEELMEFNIHEIEEDEEGEGIEIKTEVNDFYAVKDLLIKNGYNIYEAEIKLIPQDYITTLTDDSKERLERFVNSCEDDDDMQ